MLFFLARLQSEFDAWRIKAAFFLHDLSFKETYIAPGTG
jgi:hypothetical protein